MRRNGRVAAVLVRAVLTVPVAVLCLAAPAAAQAAYDMIDLSQATIENSPQDIASWPVTTAITQLTMQPAGSPAAGLALTFSALNTWPDYTPPGWDGPLQYTVWAVVKVNGKWYASGFIQMWSGRGSTGAPLLTQPGGNCGILNNFACNWAYDGRWGPMSYSVSGYEPQAGETVGFFVSAGNARGVFDVTSVRERSNVVVVKLPANDTGTFTFNGTGNTAALYAADFNSDGHPDLIAQAADGTVNLSLTTDGINFNYLQSSYNGVTSAWRIVGVGDFNGDGRPDLAWQGPTGAVVVWLNNGSSPPTPLYVYNSSSDWKIVGVADMNRDGYADLIWQSPTGQVAVWFMQGATVLQSEMVWSYESSWRIVGAADFNGDGSPDILWQGPTGAVALWTMNGFNVLSTIMLYSEPTPWQALSVGDVNGDGKPDIIWRGASGQMVVWYMNGQTMSSAQYINDTGTGWQISSTPY